MLTQLKNRNSYYMLLSIIIVNYNVKFFLEHCLLSVIKACKEIDAEIFVVDNNSSDGSEAYLSPKFPSVKFYWNKTNLGFGKANNSVLKDAKGDYILFLNPDTIVPEDCFIKCISFFRSHADCGALGVRMIDGSGHFLKESKRCLPTGSAGLFKMIGLTNAFPNSSFFAKYYAGHLPEKENNKVEVLAGAFMMLSKTAIEITKGFDETFFMYGEDIDLSYSVTKAGLLNYYFGETTILHFKGESTQKKDAAYIKHFYGAMQLFVDKHFQKNSLKHAAMSVAIKASKKITAIKNRSSTTKTLHSKKASSNTLFIGDERQFDRVKKIIKNTDYYLDAVFNVLDVVNLDEIKSIVKEKNISTIILGESDNFSNLKIIKTLFILPYDCNFLFYQNNADSIIGSNNKNERGEFISAL